jgi:hypothetical protein
MNWSDEVLSGNKEVVITEISINGESEVTRPQFKLQFFEINIIIIQNVDRRT